MTGYSQFYNFRLIPQETWLVFLRIRYRKPRGKPILLRVRQTLCERNQQFTVRPEPALSKDLIRGSLGHPVNLEQIHYTAIRPVLVDGIGSASSSPVLQK